MKSQDLSGPARAVDYPALLLEHCDDMIAFYSLKGELLQRCRSRSR